MSWESVGSETSDLRFSLTPERVDATQRQTYIDNFGSIGFVNSKTTMENVTHSPTVMDTVSASSTAMDAVSASSTAMDAVSASSTAMDAVSASTLAYSTAFRSDYSVSSLWALAPGARTILANSGDKTLPYNTSTPGGDANIEVDDGTQSATPGSTENHLWIDINGLDGDNYVSITYTIDLSNANTLKLKDKAEGVDFDALKHGVKVDGSSIFETSGQNGYNTRSLDISSFNGEHNVEFYADNTGYNNSSYEINYYFADLNLI